MTSSPPDPDSRRDSRRNEEPIAVIVAFLSLGSIFFWSISQKQVGFDLMSLGKPTATASPTASPFPAPAPSAALPSPIVAPTVGANGLGADTPPTASVQPPRPLPLVLPGATSDSGGMTATTNAPTPALTQTTQAAVSRFSDVPSDYWANPFIVQRFPSGASFVALRTTLSCPTSP